MRCRGGVESVERILGVLAVERIDELALECEGELISLVIDDEEGAALVTDAHAEQGVLDLAIKDHRESHHVAETHTVAPLGRLGIDAEERDLLPEDELERDDPPPRLAQITMKGLGCTRVSRHFHPLNRLVECVPAKGIKHEQPPCVAVFNTKNRFLSRLMV